MLKSPEKNQLIFCQPEKPFKQRDILLMLQGFFHQQYDIEIKPVVFGRLASLRLKCHHLEDKDVGKWHAYNHFWNGVSEGDISSGFEINTFEIQHPSNYTPKNHIVQQKNPIQHFSGICLNSKSASYQPIARPNCILSRSTRLNSQPGQRPPRHGKTKL